MAAKKSTAPTPVQKESTDVSARQMPLRVSPRGMLFAVAALVFLLSTWIAYTQDPRPDPFAPEPSAASWEFWRYPVERNGFRRLPVVTGGLNKIFALPDGKHLWVVGDGGLILHSADGGRHWEQLSFEPAKADAAAPAKAASEIVQSAPNAGKGKKPDAEPGLGAADPPALSAPMIGSLPDLEAVVFIDSMRGWAVGSGGTILSTADGGKTWSAQTSGTNV